MLDLREYRTKRVLLADYLPWAGLVAPGIVLNKDGSLQRTSRFRGPDLDSATDAELVAVCARLNNALKRLGSGWALFVEALRHEAAGYPESRFPDPVSFLVDRERRAMFETEGAHFESECFLTFAYRRRPSVPSVCRASFTTVPANGEGSTGGSSWRLSGPRPTA
jgi:type IV secretion system protein TrbE